MKSVLLLLALLGVGLAQKCDPAKCTGACRCMSSANPGNIPIAKTPQLVMLTFDDAVNVGNYPTYKELFLSGKQNPSKCNIGATFFVAHEYNNYAYIHQLWGAGSEIAVHSITHETNIEMWKKAPVARWTSEAVGMRTLIAKLGQITESDVKGFRAPFLQTAGNATFEVLSKQKFLYDTSLTTRAYSGIAEDTEPIWPYSFDFKNAIDCVIRPCPSGHYVGLWEVPLVSFFKLRETIKGEPPELMPCAMADACLPFPETEQDTYNYFLANFERHYKKNKAPFPLFIHHVWLQNPGRMAGYKKFFNYLMSLNDVYIVPVQEVVEYIRNPKPIETYKEKRCISKSVASKCNEKGQYCYYDEDETGGSSRVLYVCGASCPEFYPTLDNWPDME